MLRQSQWELKIIIQHIAELQCHASKNSRLVPKMMVCGEINAQSNRHKFCVVMVKHVSVKKTRGKTGSKFKMTQSYMKINEWKLKQNEPSTGTSVHCVLISLIRAIASEPN